MLSSAQFAAYKLAIAEIEDEWMVLPWRVRRLAFRNGENNKF